MNIRVLLAHEVAEQIGAQVLPERCPDCRHPLLMKPDQGLPFCWFCVTDRITAQRARTLLTKARLAARGIIVEEHRPCLEPPKKPDDDDRGPFWPEGMPL